MMATAKPVFGARDKGQVALAAVLLVPLTFLAANVFVRAQDEFDPLLDVDSIKAIRVRVETRKRELEQFPKIPEQEALLIDEMRRLRDDIPRFRAYILVLQREEKQPEPSYDKLKEG